MSGGDRVERFEGLATALAVIFAIVLAIALAFPPLSRPDSNSGYYSHAAKCANADSEYRRFLSAHAIDSYPADYSTQESKHKQEIAHWCDLAAQELTAEAGAKSANFTRLAMFAAFLGVGLLLITLWQTASMLGEARLTTLQARMATASAQEGTKIAREGVVSANRAWLDFKVKLSGEPIFVDGQIMLPVKISVINKGIWPAMNTYMSYKFVKGNKANSSVLSQMITRAEVGPRFPGMGGATYFPGTSKLSTTHIWNNIIGDGPIETITQDEFHFIVIGFFYQAENNGPVFHHVKMFTIGPCFKKGMRSKLTHCEGFARLT